MTDEVHAASDCVDRIGRADLTLFVRQELADVGRAYVWPAVLTLCEQCYELGRTEQSPALGA